jgi:AraC-like DNA-binding protein
MPLLRHRPAAPLDRYVECFWWSKRSAFEATCEHILPSGRVQLIIPLHEMSIPYRSNYSAVPTLCSGSLVHGPQWRFYIAGPKPPGAVVGVSFRPGCAPAVLRVAASELAGQHVSLNALWGRRAARLRERLLEAAEPAAIFRIMEQQLRACFHAPLLMHSAVAHALASNWSANQVSDVQRDTGFSPKHFISLFRASVGVTPKHYYRIQRFNQITRCLASGGPVKLADIADLSGYSDQAHMTREFREFSGVTPSQYRGNANSPLHHPVIHVSGLGKAT